VQLADLVPQVLTLKKLDAIEAALAARFNSLENS
jgi:hypothetical protein